jgi:PST family polysaccharide transporter
MVVGTTLAGMTALLAPALVSFYGEPRLFWVAVALGVGFIFSGAAAQHQAILLRQMRFAMLAVIEIVSLVVSIVLGVAVAALGLGYWALVVSALSQTIVSAIGQWWAAGWVPSAPQRRSKIRSILRYGGTLTLNTVVVYLAYNTEKVLLGRFLGAETLGLYGRAYTLVTLPTDNLNSTIGGVAFPALCRIQNEPERLRNYFLKGYTLFLSLVMPITVACALFAEDIILVAMGPKWEEAATIFRLLAPTILVFALINPFAWLMLAVGHAGRSLRISFLIAPVVILSYVIGLRSGPRGVAAGFSIAMVLLATPVILWAKYGTLITVTDVLKALLMPLGSAAVGAVVVMLCRGPIDKVHFVWARLIVECAILFGVYLVMNLVVMKQKPVYIGLLRDTGIWPLPGIMRRQKSN